MLRNVIRLEGKAVARQLTMWPLSWRCSAVGDRLRQYILEERTEIGAAYESSRAVEKDRSGSRGALWLRDNDRSANTTVPGRSIHSSALGILPKDGFKTRLLSFKWLSGIAITDITGGHEVLLV